MNPPTSQERIYFLDAMRSTLMTLGIILHSANVFSESQWAIQNMQTSAFFSSLVSFIHLFRMPAFFIVSGFFCHMTLKRYGHRLFINIRLPRILIPLAITAISLNSIQNWLLMGYQGTALNLLSIDYWLQGGWVSHLWFLNCLVYYFLVASILYAYTPNFIAKMGRFAFTIINRSKGLYLLAFPLLSLLLLKISYLVPEPPNNIYNLSISESIRYSLFFVFGALIGYRRELLWNLMRPNTVMICGALLLASSLYMTTEPGSTAYLYRVYINALLPWLMCFLCFFFFYKYFNSESVFFTYLSEASYTIYLFHHLFVIFYGIILINTDLNVFLKFIILITATFTTTALIHQYLILKSPVLRYLYNGKRT